MFSLVSEVALGSRFRVGSGIYLVIFLGPEIPSAGEITQLSINQIVIGTAWDKGQREGKMLALWRFRKAPIKLQHKPLGIFSI